MQPSLSVNIYYNGFHYSPSALQTFIDNLVICSDSWEKKYKELSEKYEKQVEEIMRLRAELKKDNYLWQEGYNAGVAKAKQAVDELT